MAELLLLLNAITPPIIPIIDPNIESPIPTRATTENTNTIIPQMVASCGLLLRPQPAEELKGYDNRIDVAYLAEEHLLDRRQFIERDPNNQNVRLTELGRQNCDRGMDVPPSTNQARINV